MRARPRLNRPDSGEARLARSDSCVLKAVSTTDITETVGCSTRFRIAAAFVDGFVSFQRPSGVRASFAATVIERTDNWRICQGTTTAHELKMKTIERQRHRMSGLRIECFHDYNSCPRRTVPRSRRPLITSMSTASEPCSAPTHTDDQRLIQSVQWWIETRAVGVNRLSNRYYGWGTKLGSLMTPKRRR